MSKSKDEEIIIESEDESESEDEIKKNSKKSVEKITKKEESEDESEEESEKPKNNATETITLTFGDCGENHAGMIRVGEIAKHGFTLDQLKKVQSVFKKKGAKTELVHLHIDDIETEDAYILIVRNGINYLLEEKGKNVDELFEEQKALEWDTKAFMRGAVKNKHARYNLCYDNVGQQPDYEKKKGTVVAWDDIPITKILKKNLEKLLDTKLIGEGNRYYDAKLCGIGFHGDGERRQVIGCRLGARMNLQYQWFYKGKPIGKRFEFWFNHGDFYIMSEKAVGFDWLKKNIPTLRHAAGDKKYTTIKEKKVNVSKGEGDDDKILNPTTGKYVKISGAIGKKILADQKKSRQK